MEQLFKKANLDYKTLKIDTFYDISEFELFVDSYNFDKNIIEKKLIEALVYKGEHPAYQICLVDGTYLFDCSEYHHIWDIDENDYIPIVQKEFINTYNDSLDVIQITRKKTDYKIPIVDLRVKDNHNYFANGILSHNTGGYMLRYVASTLNRVRKVADLKDGNGKMIGIQMNVRNYKNKTSIPFRENDMWLYFDKGFDSEGEYVDLVKELQDNEEITKLCKIGGAYHKSEKWGWTFRSKDDFTQNFTKNPEFKEQWEELKATIDKVLGGAIEQDKNTVDPEMMAEQNESYMNSNEAREEIESYSNVEKETQDSIVKKDEALITKSELKEVTLSES